MAKQPVTKFYAQKNIQNQHVELVVVHWGHAHDTAYAGQPIKFEVVTPEMEGQQQPPTMSLSYESTQNLINELWSLGFRPSNGEGDAGQLKATQEHLKDMKAITFKLLDSVCHEPPKILGTQNPVADYLAKHK